VSADVLYKVSNLQSKYLVYYANKSPQESNNKSQTINVLYHWSIFFKDSTGRGLRLPLSFSSYLYEKKHVLVLFLFCTALALLCFNCLRADLAFG